MKKGDIVNGYRILEDFKVTGGMSKVSFAEKGGKEFFIKEFLAPKYPTPDSPGSEKTKEKKKRACDEFERHHRELNRAIGKCCTGCGGNLVYAMDFFRNGTSFFKITEKIDISAFPCKDIAKLPFDKILLIAKSAVHSIRILHGLKIVHGDLKPENLPIKEVARGYVIKLIDFDDSYFEGNPPKDRESLVGTPEYYSPEQAAYIMDEEDVVGGKILTCKSDIFTLGIIFCEYFTGRKPILPPDYKSVWACVKDAKPFTFACGNEKVKELISKMLSLSPCDRPTIKEVFSCLKEIEIGGGESAGLSSLAKKVHLRGRSTAITGEEKKTSETEPIGADFVCPSKTKSTLRGKGITIARK